MGSEALGTLLAKSFPGLNVQAEEMALWRGFHGEWVPNGDNWHMGWGADDRQFVSLCEDGSEVNCMKGEVDNAPAAGEGLIHFPAVETHLIQSKYVQQTFKIQVMQPGRKQGDATRLPVVYATDANWTFDMFKGISYLLQMSEQDAPPFILVGIGYPGDAPHAGSLLRGRDFTFPRYIEIDVKALPVRYEGVLVADEGAKDWGGAEEFQRFFEEELIPFIDERYETIPGNRTYFGHSGGGSFGLFTLFTKSHLFQHYIVSSAGLVYHGDLPGGFHYEDYDIGPQMAQEFIASGKPLDGIKLYISVGAEEEFEPALGGWQLTSGFYRLVKVLRDAPIPGLQLMTEVFPGESHITVWPIAFTHGVQAIFGTRRVVSPVY
jgi:predicted alpha/beta superfamily hydrolase